MISAKVCEDLKMNENLLIIHSKNTQGILMKICSNVYVRITYRFIFLQNLCRSVKNSATK